MMSAALFGRRSKRGLDDPPPPTDSDGRTGPNVFSPDHSPTLPSPPPPPPEAAGPAVEADSTDAGRGGQEGSGTGPVGAQDGSDDGLIGGSLLAELEARVQSNNPAPHPVRPQEMWHPGVTPQPVDLPAPPAEERIDQADLDAGDAGPGRFRFNRLRRVTPGEASVEASGGSAAAPTPATSQEPVGDVLFGELFTSDRIPSGTEGLGSGAAPLVPRADGAAGALINGPVRRHPRSPGRALSSVPEPPQEDSVAPEEPLAGEPDLSAADPPVMPIDDHHADPVVDAMDAEEREPEVRALAVDATGSVDVADGALRLDANADATVTDDGTTLSVTMGDGWCWAALGDEARHLTIATDELVLQCPAGTTALVSIDETGHFVVAVRGEAVLEVGGRRIRLRTGAMAFLGHGASEAQVDVATEAEIAGDPLVARNLRLDAAR